MLKSVKAGLLLSSLLLVPLAAHTQEKVKGAKAPQSLVIVACRVDDLTGLPGRHDPDFAAKNWRDLEVHKNKNGEAECKREVVQIEDAALYAGDQRMLPLNPNFGDHSQCSRVSMMYSPHWNEAHKGWAVVTTGCPTPIKQDLTGDGPSEDDPTIGWKMPECPSWIKCRFDGSMI